MRDQANALRGLIERLPPPPADPMSCRSDAGCARTIAVTSGKGGIGKSNIALNLAIALAKMESAVCVLDANLGLGNIDLLCSLNGYWNLSHVVTGARSLDEVVLRGPAGISVIPGASGLADVADCSLDAQKDIFRQFEELERTHDFIVIDTATGIHGSVRRFVSAADLVLVATSPEPTSIANAYATIKALCGSDRQKLNVLVNQAESAPQAHAISERLMQTARVFLGTDVRSAGHIPYDHHVPAAVLKRDPFLISNPQCPASRAIEQLGRRMKSLAASRPGRRTFFPHLYRTQLRKAA